MVEANEFYEPIFETNGDPVEHDIASPVDPIIRYGAVRKRAAPFCLSRGTYTANYTSGIKIFLFSV